MATVQWYARGDSAGHAEILGGLVLYTAVALLCSGALLAFVRAVRASDGSVRSLCRAGVASEDEVPLLGVERDLARVGRYKLWFHVFLVASYLLEWTVALTFAIAGAGTRAQRDTYAVHLVALFCFFLAFCCVVLVWGTSVRVQHVILGQGDAEASFQAFHLGVLGLVVVYAAILINSIAYCYAIPDFDRFLHHPAYEILALYVAGTLLFVSLGILALGSVIHLRMLRVRPFMRREARFWLNIGKLNLTMGVSAVCFGIWTAALLWLSQHSDSGDNGGLGISGIWWHVLCRWTPHVIPGILFLFFMRHVSAEEPRDPLLQGDSEIP